MSVKQTHLSIKVGGQSTPTIHLSLSALGYGWHPLKVDILPCVIIPQMLIQFIQPFH